MSQEYDQQAFEEEVRNFIEETDGMSFIPKRAKQLWDAKEYEQLKAFMYETNASLSQEHFHGYDLLEATDVF